MKHLVRLVVVVALFTPPFVSHATVIGSCNTKVPALCTQSVDINASGTQFTITLTNSGKGGYITADAFSLPGTLGASLVSTTNPSFALISGDIKVVPVTPAREFLLTIDPTPNAKSSFQGGGSPKSGIAPGSTVTFVFNITGGTLADTFTNESSIFGSQVTRLRGSGHRRGDDAVAPAATPASVTSGPASSVTTSFTPPRVDPISEAARVTGSVNISSAVAFGPVLIPEAASFVLLGVGLIALRIAGKRIDRTR